MSSFAKDPEGGMSGRRFNNNLDSNFQNEVSQALAIKLDLKTKQHANTKALKKLLRLRVFVLPLRYTSLRNDLW